MKTASEMGKALRIMSDIYSLLSVRYCFESF